MLGLHEKSKKLQVGKFCVVCCVCFLMSKLLVIREGMLKNKNETKKNKNRNRGKKRKKNKNKNKNKDEEE